MANPINILVFAVAAIVCASLSDWTKQESPPMVKASAVCAFLAVASSLTCVLSIVAYAMV